MKKKRYFLFFLTILFVFNFNFSVLNNKLDKNIDFHCIGVQNAYAIAGVDDVLVIGGITVTVGTVLKIIASAVALSGTTYVACNYQLIAEKAKDFIRDFASQCKDVSAVVAENGQRFLKFTKANFQALVSYLKSNAYKLFKTCSDAIQFVSDGIAVTFDKLSSVESGTVLWQGLADAIGVVPTVGRKCELIYSNAGKNFPKYIRAGYYSESGDFFSTAISIPIDETTTKIENPFVTPSINADNIKSDISVPVNYDPKTKVYDVENTSALEKADDYVVAGTQAIPVEEEIPSTSTAGENIPILGDIWSLIKKILKAILNLPSLIASAISSALSWIGEKISAIPSAVAGAFGWLKEKIDALPSAISSALGWVGEKISAIPSAIADVFAPVISFVKNFFGAPTVSLDFSPFYDIGFSNKFPFSLPFDLYKAITKFSVSSSAPKFVITSKYFFNGATLMTLDFAKFSEFATIVKFFLLAIFFIGLIKITNSIIKE